MAKRRKKNWANRKTGGPNPVKAMCSRCGDELWVKRGTKNPKCPTCIGNGNKKQQRASRYRVKKVEVAPEPVAMEQAVSDNPISPTEENKE